MQVVFNVLVVVGSSIEKVDPGFCLLSLAGRRQPAAPPPVAVRQSSGRPPVQPAMCVGGGPQPAAYAKKCGTLPNSGGPPENGRVPHFLKADQTNTAIREYCAMDGMNVAVLRTSLGSSSNQLTQLNPAEPMVGLQTTNALVGSSHIMLFLASSEMRARVGRGLVEEQELLPLLLAANVVRLKPRDGVTTRSRTRSGRAQLGHQEYFHRWDPYTMIWFESEMYDAATTPWKNAWLVNARANARGEGGLFEQSALIALLLEHAIVRRVRVVPSGAAPREDNAAPERRRDGRLLKNGDAVVLAVEDAPLAWRNDNTPNNHPTHQTTHNLSLTTAEFTTGMHYWEMKLLLPSCCVDDTIQIGVCRPNLDWGWFTGEELKGAFEDGDRIGVLLNLNTGSLRFFRNGKPLGCAADHNDVVGPVALATHLCLGASIEMLPYAKAPIQHMWWQGDGPMLAE